uniref:RNA-directed RNA polymerase n=1 Tax=Leviviridae sp. TaxID=2027243 RepID=A0A514D884_9VIRU|nr:MAG: RNA-dependent RNA polymerase [Leviviridae sp.]
MRTKYAQGKVLNLPRLKRDEVARAVAQLAQLLEIPSGVFTGPLAKRVLDFADVKTYRMERLKQDFFKKYPGFSWGNPRETAIKEFHRCESQNEATNARLRRYSEKGIDPLGIGRYIRNAQCLISEWLGAFNWQDLISEGRFGPGVTSSVKGLRLHASQKFQAKPEVTPAFARTGRWLISHLPSWSNTLTGVEFPTWVTPLLDITPGNRVTFVPKDSTTDRSIAVEPTVNIYFQLAMGSVLREKLRTQCAIDLNSQELNQRLARLGSIDDTLSTIDLKSASNTLSYRCVMMLLPPDWFEALDRLRSQFGTLDGKKFPYQMFSSMGNGFTFELETMIFYSLCLSVAQLDGYNPFWVSAYGDDLIVPSGIYEKVVDVLSFCGFTVNLEKSYHTGPFRESCGKDYLRGSLVRPVYLREIPDNPMAWIKIANNLKRLASVWGEGKSLDLRLKPAYDFAVNMVPRFYRRFSVSDGYGDVALIRDLDDSHLVTRAPNGWEGYVTPVIMTRPKKFFFNGRSLITAGVSTPGRSGNSLPFRDAVEHTINPLVVAIWRNMGVWS